MDQKQQKEATFGINTMVVFNNFKASHNAYVQFQANLKWDGIDSTGCLIVLSAVSLHNCMQCFPSPQLHIVNIFILQVG